MPQQVAVATGQDDRLSQLRRRSPRLPKSDFSLYTSSQMLYLLPVLLAAALVAWIHAAKAQGHCHQVQGTLHRRNYFYVGQSYNIRGNSTIASGQIYVEHLAPAKVTQPFPLLLMHGNGERVDLFSVREQP